MTGVDPRLVGNGAASLLDKDVSCAISKNQLVTGCCSDHGVLGRFWVCGKMDEKRMIDV